MKDEFFRLYATGYGFGKLDSRDEVNKELYRLGQKPSAGSKSATFTGAEVVRLQKEAFKEAGEFADAIMRDVRAVVRAAVGPSGRLAVDVGDVEKQIREVFDTFLEAETTVIEFAAARRPAKIRDRAAWLKWQQEKKPYSQWIRDQLKARKQKVRKLNKNQLETRCLTGYSKWYNRGKYVDGMERTEVVEFFLTGIRDAKICALCLALDKTIRPKKDPIWGRITPPQHWRCRCRIVPIVKGERPPNVPLTPKRDIQNLQPMRGFGGTAKSTGGKAAKIPQGLARAAERPILREKTILVKGKKLTLRPQPNEWAMPVGEIDLTPNWAAIPKNPKARDFKLRFGKYFKMDKKWGSAAMRRERREVFAALDMMDKVNPSWVSRNPYFDGLYFKDSLSLYKQAAAGGEVLGIYNTFSKNVQITGSVNWAKRPRVNQLDHVMFHEVVGHGHQQALKGYAEAVGKIFYVFEKEIYRELRLAGVYPSSYARTNVAEYFSESVAMYWSYGSGMKTAQGGKMKPLYDWLKKNVFDGREFPNRKMKMKIAD